MRTLLTGLAVAAVMVRVASAAELQLAAGGKTSAVIMVAADATAAEKHAAEELARFLKEISGAEFPVADPRQVLPAVARPLLFVGPGAAEHVIPAAEIASLGLEGYLIRFADADSGGTIAIAGGRPRGTLYGVYSFLEDRLGCRWFTPDCSRIPKRADLKVDVSEKKYIPPLEYRATDYPNSRDGDWAARNKLNGTQTRIDAARGGKIDYHHFVHTFNAILNPAASFKDHPEYFSQVKGTRISDRPQLCLTNPEVLRIATQTVRRWMQEAPHATIFSVSQNDWHNPCECASCAKVTAEEDAHSGELLRFVNAIAAALKDEFPGKAVDTLAYQYTRKPPALVKPLPNVIVRLCSIECCFAHPLESPESLDPANAAFARDIAAWSKICDRLYIWDYVIDYSHSIMPFPNLYSLAPNIRFFIKNGVRGIYEEADYFTKGGEMAELRTWIMAKTLWDPSYDTDRAIAEFLEGYYEEAAGALGMYIAFLHERAAGLKAHFPIWAQPDNPLFGGDFLEKSEKLFDAAESSVAAKPEVLHRVRVARLPVTYVRIEKLAKAVSSAKEPVASDRETIKVLLDRFAATAKAEGLNMVSEGKQYSAWLAERSRLTAGK